MEGKMMGKLFVLAAILSLGTVVCGALQAGSTECVEIPVSPGAGALEKARESVRAAKKAHPGRPVTVTLAPGEYVVDATFVLGPEDSGTPEAPVTWRGKGAVIRGGLDLVGWSDDGEGVWSVAWPKDARGRFIRFDQLFVGERRASRSVWPKNRENIIPISFRTQVLTNAVTHQVEGVEETLGLTNAADRAFLSAIPKDELREVHAVVRRWWSAGTRWVHGWDPEKGELTFRTHQKRPMSPMAKWDDTARMRFDNVRRAFTEKGEWFSSKKDGRVYYRPMDGERLESFRAIVPTGRLGTLFRLEGQPGKIVHDIRFEGQTFAYSDTAQLAGENPDAETIAMPSQAASWSDGTVMGRCCERILFTRCRVAHTAAYGAKFVEGSRQVSFTHCRFEDLGAGGIHFGTTDKRYVEPGKSIRRQVIAPSNPLLVCSNLVSDCVIRDGGHVQREGVGVFLSKCADTTVTHCLIEELFYSGVSVGWEWGYHGSVSRRNTISFNRIREIGRYELSDMGGIYMLGVSYGTCVSNNWISGVKCYRGRGGYGGTGLYTDQGSEGIVFENNLVEDTFDGGISQHYGCGCEFRNNIIVKDECGHLASTQKPLADGIPSSIHLVGNIFMNDKPGFLCHGGMIRTAGVRANNVWYAPESRDSRFGQNPKGFAHYRAINRSSGDVFEDPQFVDFEHGDYRLRETSPALRLGFRSWDYRAVGPRD